MISRRPQRLPSEPNLAILHHGVSATHRDGFLYLVAYIMEKINETWREIEQNSPTKNSFVNIDLIQKLKERRTMIGERKN
jgi:hypothetical protein